MPRCKLFDNWTFKLELPAPFDDPSVQKQRTDIYSMYSTTAKRSTIHAPTLHALLKYASLVDACENNAWTSDLGAIGNQGDTFLIAEYPSSETQCVIYNRNTAKFIAGIISTPGDPPGPYSISSSAHTGAALFFCLLPQIADDAEFNDAFQEFLEEFRDNFSDLDAASRTVSILCDNIYRRIESAASLGAAGINVSIPSTGNVNTLNKLAVDTGQYTPDAALYGEFTMLQVGRSPSVAAAVIPHADLVGKYPLSSRTLTADELALVPVLPTWYVIPEDVQSICKHLQQTTATASPMRNIMLRGPAGTGKTEASKAIAAGLGLPYLFLTCSANTETFDLLGQILPATEANGVRQLREKYSLPTLEDIMMDPPSAYAQMTGEYLESITEDQVFAKMLEIMGSSPSEEGASGKQQFEFVETPLVRALRNGYLIELQEPTVIANPGVLVGLNSILDRCASVTLPNGQMIQRHPDTVIVMTTNTEYEGCRGLNQSLSSRMNLIIDMDEPDLQTTVRRVMGITGNTDQATVTRMAEVVQGINQRCRETMITDGTCGIRELIAWVQSSMITKDIYSSALYTVISSATASRENREDLITILENQFTR